MYKFIGYFAGYFYVQHNTSINWFSLHFTCLDLLIRNSYLFSSIIIYYVLPGNVIFQQGGAPGNG